MLASADDDGEIMSVEHRTHPAIGVQFHPESAASQYGYAMLDRFILGDRSRPGLPTGADGVDGEESAHRAAEAQTSPVLPWGPPDDDRNGGFVPPPVELVR